MSFTLTHNRPLKIIHLYFDEEQEVMATCLLPTKETVELSIILRTVVRRPVNINARQFCDWQNVKSQFLDDFADVVADTSHISSQSDRAMSHFLATRTSPRDVL